MLIYIKTNFLRLIRNRSEVVAQKCSVKKALLEISQNSQESTCVRVCNFIKRLWHRWLLVNFAKSLITIFLTENLWWLLLILIYLFFNFSFSIFLYRTLKVLCTWKMIKNIYGINQHWTGNCPVKYCQNKFIYIKAFS